MGLSALKKIVVMVFLLMSITIMVLFVKLQIAQYRSIKLIKGQLEAVETQMDSLKKKEDKSIKDFSTKTNTAKRKTLRIDEKLKKDEAIIDNSIVLMMSLKTFSQDTAKITIKKSTLVSIMKESRKCDSVRVAFNQKSIVVDSLIRTNIDFVDILNELRNDRIELERQLKTINEDHKKLIKKNKRGWQLPVAIGTVLGLIIGSQI